MKRVLICGLFRYPRGNATANYVQYLAACLKDAGYEVEILSYVNPEFLPKGAGVYLGCHVSDIAFQSRISIFQRLMNGKLFAFQLTKKLKTYHLTNEDLVITLGGYVIQKPVTAYREKAGFKIAGCPLEWFSSEQITDKREWDLYCRAFEMYRKYDLIFPISRHIAEHFAQAGCKIMVLPIMADVLAYPAKAKQFDKYRIIYPANGMLKDSADSMLKSVASLDEARLAKIEFHLCGMNEQTVTSSLTREEMHRLSGRLVIHPWLRYDKLIELYQRMHFLFLARPIKQMTLSNFPSKVPEAMCCGIVPIASRVGDYTSLYLEDGKNSLVFDGCSVADCKTALERAIDLPIVEYQELSTGARKCAQDKFDYHNWTDKIRQAIQSL